MRDSDMISVMKLEKLARPFFYVAHPKLHDRDMQMLS